MAEKPIQFVRSRDYVLLKELGRGACGKTVLLRDDAIDENFVCKKYEPFYPEHKTELFKNFVKEIKILHLLYHKNVVRIFNYYLYPDQFVGYILMEYIQGIDIEDYVKKFPERVNEIFIQTIDGFQYLESQKVLHRDIRAQNILVSGDDTVKIIDLGFGKQIQTNTDFDKSITLNWWCDPPSEFKKDTYDFTTEVYFVGKLFEKIIQDQNIEHFKYNEILGLMCKQTPGVRIANFSKIQTKIQTDLFHEIEFDEEELDSYRNFSKFICSVVTKIENGTKYIYDIEQIKTQLEPAYRACMLENECPDSKTIINCFLSGAYYYKKKGFPVWAVREFLQLLKSSSQEKQRIVLSNIHSKFDSIPRYFEAPMDISLDEEIPF